MTTSLWKTCSWALLLFAAQGWVATSAIAADAASQTPTSKIHIYPTDFAPAGTPLTYGLFGNTYSPILPTPVGPSVEPLSGQSLFFPGDVTKTAGSVLKTASQHLIFVNCADIATCWGNIPQFLGDLNGSLFIKVLNQYVTSSAAHRYPVTEQVHKSVSLPHVALDSDIRTIVTQVFNANGHKGGYTNLYHVFLKKGQDECFDGALTQCYAPDGSGTFVFCGYHSAFNIGSVHVVYSVEPFQKVNGCQGTSTNTLQNTANTLSHEIFEAASDPDLNTNFVTTGILKGNEIGDICAFVRTSITLGARNYILQREYSNAQHACVTQ